MNLVSVIHCIAHMIDERCFNSEAVGSPKIGRMNEVIMPIQAQIG